MLYLMATNFDIDNSIFKNNLGKHGGAIMIRDCMLRKVDIYSNFSN
jgi:hypothetical protein